MHGKEMDGWLRVTSDAVADDDDLVRWVGDRHDVRREPAAQVAIRRRPPLRTRCMRSRLAYALFGVLATLVGVAAGHLVASLLNPASYRCWPSVPRSST